MTTQEDLLLFAPSASADLGGRVAQALGTALAPCEEREFEDGEHKARPLVSVRGRDVYVLQSLFGDEQQSVNDKLCRLLFLIATLKDASAARVTAVVPYLAYARKDRRTQSRDPVTTRYVAALFEAVGADRVVVLDVHNLAAFQNAFRCPSEHLEAVHLLADALLPLAGRGAVAVISPDAGGVNRAERLRAVLADRLARPVGMGFVEKHRARGVVSGGMLVGTVHDATTIILDDMVSTGGTMVRAARACREGGAGRVIAAATHGVLAAEAPELLADPVLDHVVLTNSVTLRPAALTALGSRLVTISVAPLLGEAIRRLHTGGSLVELAGG